MMMPHRIHPARFVAMVGLLMIAATFGAPAQAAGQQVNFSFTVVSAAAGADRIILTGDGAFNSAQVVGNGTFLHFLAGAPPATIVGQGTWKARRLTSFTLTGTYGVGVSGVLVMEVDLVPNGGGVIPATMTVVCNIGPGGLNTGLVEGVKLEILAGPTFNQNIGNTFFSTGVEARR